MNDVAKVIARMQASKRATLLALLAESINQFTFVGRFRYESPTEQHSLRMTNEAIHRLTGHLRDLCRPEEVFTPSRADGVREQLALLPANALASVYEFRTQ